MPIELSIDNPPFECPLCEKYVEKHREGTPKTPVACCEGPCLRGEIARRVANKFTSEILSNKLVRVCLPGVISTHGQRALFLSGKAIVIEGCALKCGTRLLSAAISDCSYHSIVIDRLYEFDRNLYSVDEMPKAELDNHVRTVVSSLIGSF